jgi:hypothetical protein
VLSAVTNHLESGKCRSGTKRAELNELLFARDQNRYLTCEAAFSALMWESRSIDSLGLPDDTGAIIPPTEDEDSFSKWSILNGVSLLTPTTAACNKSEPIRRKAFWFSIINSPTEEEYEERLKRFQQRYCHGSR